MYRPRAAAITQRLSSAPSREPASRTHVLSGARACVVALHPDSVGRAVTEESSHVERLVHSAVGGVVDLLAGYPDEVRRGVANGEEDPEFGGRVGTW